MLAPIARTMTPAMIEKAGKLLFGAYWRHPFEAHFHVSNRALRRMLKGEQSVPVGLVRDLETAVRDHVSSADDLLETLVEVTG